MPNRQTKSTGSRKQMNTQIKELVDQLPINADVAKSIGNRLESALTKSGSASSRLRMASQSMNALASKLTDDENGYADLFARIFEIGALIGVDNKKPTEPKATREVWFDADSPQAKAILATKSPRKPRKNKSVAEAVPTQELIEAFMRAMASR
jgi:hypothetical protein